MAPPLRTTERRYGIWTANPSTVERVWKRLRYVWVSWPRGLRYSESTALEGPDSHQRIGSRRLRRRPQFRRAFEPGMTVSAGIVSQVAQDREHAAVVFGDGIQLELCKDAPDVLFDGAVGDHELLGDAEI